MQIKKIGLEGDPKMLNKINAILNERTNSEHEFYTKKFAEWLLFTKFKNRKFIYELVHDMLKDGWSVREIMKGYVCDEKGEYFAMSKDASVLSFIYGRTEIPAFTVTLTSVPATYPANCSCSDAEIIDIIKKYLNISA
jgi:hypothetical protein